MTLFVPDFVTLEYHTGFELPKRVVLRKLGSFLDQDLKYPTDMRGDTLAPRFRSNFMPLTNLVL